MNILKSINIIDESSTILSTGQSPESRKDLLVVGGLSRDDFQTSLVNNLAGVAETILSDDAVIVQQNDSKVGVAYYDESSFTSFVTDIADGRAVDPVVKQWSTGPWLPETFASDMARAQVLSDVDSDVGHVVEMFQEYPDGLRKAITDRALSEIIAKTIMLESGQHELPSKFLAMDICLASMRLLYATEKVYFRGFKYESITRTKLSDEASIISFKLMTHASSEDSSLAVNHYALSKRSSN